MFFPPLLQSTVNLRPQCPHYISFGSFAVISNTKCLFCFFWIIFRKVRELKVWFMIWYSERLGVINFSANFKQISKLSNIDKLIFINDNSKFRSAIWLSYFKKLLISDRAPPYPPLGLIWTVMLVWRKGNINWTVSVL